MKKGVYGLFKLLNISYKNINENNRKFQSKRKIICRKT